MLFAIKIHKKRNIPNYALLYGYNIPYSLWVKCVMIKKEKKNNILNKNKEGCFIFVIILKL